MSRVQFHDVCGNYRFADFDYSDAKSKGVKISKNCATCHFMLFARCFHKMKDANLNLPKGTLQAAFNGRHWAREKIHSALEALT